MRDELLDPAEGGDDEVAVDAGLRPRRLADFVGQRELKDHLSIVLEAARRRGQPADHLLFAGPPGLGKPVDVDTLVLMADGSRRRIGDIVVGDRVISGAGRACAVIGVWEQGELNCLRLTTHRGRSVVAAPDHPFLTPEGWVKAGDLAIGDALGALHRPRTEPASTPVPDEAFRLAGYFVGDGNTTSTRNAITNGDREVLDDIHRCAEALGFPTRELPNSAGSKLVILRKALPWLRSIGLKGQNSHQKRVPSFVFTGSNEQVAHFLAAYFLCDGHVSKRSRDRYDVVAEYYSVSRALLADTQHLLVRLGVEARLCPKRGRYLGEVHHSWRLTMTSQDDLASFRNQLPLVGAKHRRLQDWQPKRTSFDQPIRADRIVAVEAVGLRPCRCITVADDATYTVSDLVCHNTSLAHIVAHEVDARIHVTSGPAIERAGDLAALLSNLEPGDVLFVDEIHRLSRAVEEVLYPAMEDFQVDILLGKGPAARSIRLDVSPFTLVGATTRTGLITGPLRDRFGLVARLDYYDAEDLEAIVVRAAGILGVDASKDGAWEIARRSRGTPRIANRLLRRVRDYAEVRGEGVVDEAAAQAGLELFGVDALGLDKVDRAVLRALCERFGGGPVGLKTLAISVGEPEETVEDVYEPFLIQQGLLLRTPRGRVATPAAWHHLGLAAPEPGARPLF